MSLLSPGVEIIEIDASAIAPTVSNSIACFAGDFDQGPVGVYMLITNEDELVSFYGKPTKKNYNDWAQASSFLKYGNKLFVSRAANTNASTEEIDGVTVTEDVINNTIVNLSGNLDKIKIGDYVAFGNDEGSIKITYVVMSKSVDSNNYTSSIELDRAVSVTVADDNKIYSISQSMNSVFDAVEDGATAVSDVDYVRTQIPVLNYSDFENKETSIAMNGATSKLKFIAKNPGNWGNDIEVAIANSEDFGQAKQAFEGISLDDLFEYYPVTGEFGIVVRINGQIKETFTVSFDENAKDQNYKSMYVETVINTKSNYLFVKDNSNNINPIDSYLFSEPKGTIFLVNGTDSVMGLDDLNVAYEVWDNKEEVDVDIVIGNELDSGLSAKALVDVRKDCIAFIGANREDTVGLKASDIVSKLVAWRKTGALNYNDMFVVAAANYAYVYNKYLDKYVWINNVSPVTKKLVA